MQRTVCRCYTAAVLCLLADTICLKLSLNTVVHPVTIFSISALPNPGFISGLSTCTERGFNLSSASKGRQQYNSDLVDKIHVLMSTYNGRKYIKEQLDSIMAQDCQEKGIASLFLIVRDLI